MHAEYSRGCGQQHKWRTFSDDIWDVLSAMELVAMSTNSREPRIDDEHLPATCRTQEHDLISPNSNFSQFLSKDLSVQRIEDVLPHLWLVGRPYPARALNIQRVMKREIVATTDASLHLVWTTGKIYVKALPRYMTTPSFYDQCLGPPPPRGPAPHGPALGLLFSYMALISTELDFAIARELHLIHEGYKWHDWRRLTSRILGDYPHNTIYTHIPRRYIRGELRSSRLDKLFRYRYGELLHGYSALLGNTRYVTFFEENLKFVTAATVYTAVVLTAMQVGLTGGPLQHNDSFIMASYGFTIFAILSPILGVCFVVAVAIFMIFANWASTTAVYRRRYKHLGIEDAQASQGAKHRASFISP